MLNAFEFYLLPIELLCEVQSQYDSGFKRRMFVYHYRLFDRYQLPIVSLAVLGDDSSSWKPTTGC